MGDRRSFLRGLATLPLIGGSVALIGQPTAAAIPVTEGLLDSYEQWLDLERSFLRWQRYGLGFYTAPRAAHLECIWRDRETGRLWDTSLASGTGFNHQSPPPSKRAAVILSAAGVPIGGDA